MIKTIKSPKFLVYDMQIYSQIWLSVLIILFGNLTILSEVSEAKPPNNVSEFWSLQPSCPGLNFQIYGKGRKFVEDTANGYLEVGNDSTSMAIAIFKQANGEYIVGVNQIDTVSDRSCFLRYKNGLWQDISKQIVPNYSLQNFYQMPLQGTIVSIFPLIKIDNEGMTNRGSKKGELYWQKGKFTTSR